MFKIKINIFKWPGQMLSKHTFCKKEKVLNFTNQDKPKVSTLFNVFGFSLESCLKFVSAPVNSYCCYFALYLFPFHICKFYWCYCDNYLQLLFSFHNFSCNWWEKQHSSYYYYNTFSTKISFYISTDFELLHVNFWGAHAHFQTTYQTY